MWSFSREHRLEAVAFMSEVDRRPQAFDRRWNIPRKNGVTSQNLAAKQKAGKTEAF